MLQFLHLQYEDNNSNGPTELLEGLNEMIHIKPSEQRPAQSKGL